MAGPTSRFLSVSGPPRAAEGIAPEPCCRNSARVYTGIDMRLEDAAWGGSSALRKILPIELHRKQSFLEMDDPIQRLDALAPFGAGPRVDPLQDQPYGNRPREYQPPDETRRSGSVESSAAQV